MRLLLAMLAALALALASEARAAEAGYAVVVPGGCGTATYGGGNQPVTQDTTGRECSASTAVSAPVTPAAGTTGTLTTGGTSYTIVTGPVTGCYVYNGLTAAEQGGITAAEPANIDPVATPVVGLVTTTTIQPGQPWSCPGRLATGVLVKANATTNGHKLNVVTW